MNIKTNVAAFAAFAMTLPAGVQAQQDAQALRDASVTLYNVCAFAAGDVATDAGCACTAGFIGGVLTEREYDIAARLGRLGMLTQSGASESEIQAERDAFYAAGYTDADVENVLSKLQYHTARGDAICSPYENRNSS